MAVIEAVDLGKTFRVRRRAGRIRRRIEEVVAVSGLTFSIEPGEMVGYIGPNGAGKSTTIKMLTGILVPSHGSVRVNGLDPTRKRIEVARNVGVVFGQRSQLWWDLPLIDSFDLLRRVYRVEDAAYREALDELIALLDLDELLEVPVRQLSLGQRMRGDIAAALLHDPAIVYLDEPTIGLDVVSKARVREFLARRNAERGTTVLLTTHDLDDIERLCERVMIIDHGKLLFDGGLNDVIERLGEERTLVVDLAERTEPLEIPGTRVISVEGTRQRLAFKRSVTSAASVVAAVAGAAEIVELSIEEPDIESRDPNSVRTWDDVAMAMREDCKHYATRTYASGEMVRMCRLDLAPEAPWKCPEDCPSYTRRTWDAGWTLGQLADTQPDPSEPTAKPEDVAALLDMAEDVINNIGADVLAEHRAAQEKKNKGFLPKFKRKRGKR